MKRITYLCCISLLLSLPACDLQKALDDFELQYIGNWSSDKFHLEISANGRGYLERRGIFGFDGTEGRIKITDNRIKFRSDERDRNFRIDESPFREEGEIIMILDGKTFYKH
ncbi:MAG: hypothetical protein AAF849_19800 [Bacteroidota bacterium]